jgi:hypothetical protein
VVPPDYQKLGGPWINGQDPSEPGAKKAAAPSDNNTSVDTEVSQGRQGVLSKIRKRIRKED